MLYSIVKTEDRSFLTVFTNGQAYPVDDGHIHWNEILTGVINDDESVIDLFDITEAISKQYKSVSERISIGYGRLYFDGDEIHNSLTDHIVRLYQEAKSPDDAEEYARSLILFLEKIQTNPQEHSRTQLYDWLQDNDFTINQFGNIVAYKGVRDYDGRYFSLTSGNAWVNGKEYHGRIPNDPGSIVRMPRSQVIHDPDTHCSVGLHAATYEFAKYFAGTTGTVLKIFVNPRDVVSVPADGSADKFRCCRYTVGDKVSEAYQLPLIITDDYWNDEEDGSDFFDEYEYDDEDEEYYYAGSL
jgi:hypothetical protein